MQPVVIVAHTAAGPHEAFITDMLDELASQGYMAFALDLYGAEHATSKQENRTLLQGLKTNRPLIAERALAALLYVRQLPGADVKRVAILGFCLGGMCAMDMLRAAPSGQLQLVVSFHGILDKWMPTDSKVSPETRVVAFHGYSDPMVSNDNLIAFCDEMEQRGADYEVRVLGANILHAFMRPDKTAREDAEAGLQYNAKVAKRAWADTLALLDDI